MTDGPRIPDHLEEVSFAELPGWDTDDHRAALVSFLRFCDKPESFGQNALLSGLNPDILEPLCREAAQSAAGSGIAARRFFESRFVPYRIAREGFVTGYFEPELSASREKTADFAFPLLGKPAGLETVTDSNRPDDWPDHLSHGRRVNGKLTEMPDRGAIMDGALDAEGLELVWLADPVDAFYIHVQGSARLRLADGSVMRVGYAGKTGHPYTGIARLLVKRGEGTPEDFTMAGTRAWLERHPDKRDALFKENRSYIFFREVTEVRPEHGPVGGAGLALTAGRSLAVDPAHIPYGMPVFVGARFEDPVTRQPLQRLMMADDTGSAIKGPARGDIFVGSGEAAGAIAGEIRHKATFTLLLPRAVPGPGPVVTD